MPSLTRAEQVQRLIDLGFSPLDAERIADDAEALAFVNGRFDVQQVQAGAEITFADIADARADWYASRAIPRQYKRLLDAKVADAQA